MSWMILFMPPLYTHCQAHPELRTNKRQLPVW